MPTVINRHHYADPRSGKPDRRPPLPSPWMYIGRGTPLGNPFLKVDGENPMVPMRRYHRWLWGRIRDPRSEQAAALRRITDEHHLVCSCKRPDGSGLCHGDIVVKAWAWLREQESTDRRGELAEHLGHLTASKHASTFARDLLTRERERQEEDARRHAAIQRQVEDELRRRRAG